jgi:hypothetical protein
MTESAQRNRLTLVKPRSTWVITSKTPPANPIEPLNQVNTHLWSTLGQRHGRVVRSTTLVFTARCTSVQIFGINLCQPRLQRSMSRKNTTSCPLLFAARAARRTAASTSGLARAFPKPPLPKAGSTPRCLEVFPCHVPRRPSPVGHTTMDRRSVPYPGTCAPTKAAAVPRREVIGLLDAKQATSRL